MKYLSETVASLIVVFLVGGWMMIAVIRFFRDIRREQKNRNCPYWAEDGDSENIRALRY